MSELCGTTAQLSRNCMHETPQLAVYARAQGYAVSTVLNLHYCSTRRCAALRCAALPWLEHVALCCAVLCSAVQLTHDHDYLGQVLRLLQAPANNSGSSKHVILQASSQRHGFS
jgi:hypothetical protein